MHALVLAAVVLVSKVPGFDADVLRTFPQTNGVAKAIVRQFRIVIRQAGKADVFRDVFLIYDRSHRTCWWVPLEVRDPAQRVDCASSYPGDATRIVLARDRIGTFMLAPPLGLYVRSSVLHAESLADAETAVLQTIRTNPAEALDFYHAYLIVGLDGVGSDFVEQPGSATIPSATLLAVGRANGRWLLRLRSPRREIADVTLDDGYRVVAVRRHFPRGTHLP